MLYDWLSISHLGSTLNSSKELQTPDDSMLISQLCVMTIRNFIIQKRTIYTQNNKGVNIYGHYI